MYWPWLCSRGVVTLRLNYLSITNIYGTCVSTANYSLYSYRYEPCFAAVEDPIPGGESLVSYISLTSYGSAWQIEMPQGLPKNYLYKNII